MSLPVIQKSSEQQKKNRTASFEQRATNWIGSTVSLVIHTFLFLFSFLLGLFGVNWDRVLLVLTTLVSLEAIYLAIFIQIGVNRTNQSLKDVEEDIEEIQEDVGELQEDVEEIQEDVGEIQEDVVEIQDDFDDVQKDFSQIQGKMEGPKNNNMSAQQAVKIPQDGMAQIERKLADILKEIEKLRNN